MSEPRDLSNAHDGDALDAEAIQQALETQWLGTRVFHLPETDSTNDVAWKLAEAGLPHGTVVLADCQHQGRGSRGRKWQAPPGSALLVSIVLRADVPPQHLPGLTSTASIGATEAIRELCDVDVEILWPNDLVIGTRKLGGLLVESRTPAPHGRSLVVGFGINVHQTPAEWPPDLRDLAVSIDSASGRRNERRPLLLSILQRMECRFDQLIGGRIEDLQRALDLFARLPGRRAEFELDRGPVRGTVLGVTLFGSVSLRTDDGRTIELPPETILGKRELVASG